MTTDFKTNSLRPPLKPAQVINNASKPPAFLPQSAPAPAPPPKPPAATAEPPKEPRECDATHYGKAKTERRTVTFRMRDGTTVVGMIVAWSRFCVLVDTEGGLVTVFKHGALTAKLENPGEESHERTEKQKIT
jgi:sRNA-binding regulator protein Hfq